MNEFKANVNTAGVQRTSALSSSTSVDTELIRVKGVASDPDQKLLVWTPQYAEILVAIVLIVFILFIVVILWHHRRLLKIFLKGIVAIFDCLSSV
jgi:hypothetical protein